MVHHDLLILVLQYVFLKCKDTYLHYHNATIKIRKVIVTHYSHPVQRILQM